MSSCCNQSERTYKYIFTAIESAGRRNSKEWTQRTKPVTFQKSLCARCTLYFSIVLRAQHARPFCEFFQSLVGSNGLPRLVACMICSQFREVNHNWIDYVAGTLPVISLQFCTNAQHEHMPTIYYTIERAVRRLIIAILRLWVMGIIVIVCLSV